jgi:hypothetical protein
MQWHWGNIGSAAAGLATLIVTLRLLWSAPDWYRTWKERQNAERDLAVEQTKAIELERRRGLYGWSDNIETYRVALVTDAHELDQAAQELARGGVSDYVVMRVAESDQPYGNVNRADSLRQLVGQGLISRPPSAGEREALEKGLAGLGITSAAESRRQWNEAAQQAIRKAQERDGVQPRGDESAANVQAGSGPG